jgi:hypothetical protein
MQNILKFDGLCGILSSLVGTKVTNTYLMDYVLS